MADDDGGGRPRRRRRRAVTVGAVAAVVFAGALAVAVTVADGDDEDAVALLTRVPARNALAALPDEIRPGQVFLLQSTVERPVRWRVRTAADAPWLRVEPASGELGPRATTEIEVRIDDAAPEGPLRIDLTVTGDDGSTVLVRLGGAIEHPPTLAAAADGCIVTAKVEDETSVEAVELHWRADDGAEARRPMPLVDAGYRATVPEAFVPGRWWVTAVDGRGNRARSPEEPVTAC